MAKVTQGERDQRSLQQTAVEAMEKKPSTEQVDPAPNAQPPAEPAAPAKPSDDPLGSEAAPEGGEKPDDTPAEDLTATRGEQDQPEDGEKPEKGDRAPTREALRKGLKQSDEEALEEDLRGVKPADPERFRKRIKHYEGLVQDRDKVITNQKTQLEQLQDRLAALEKQGADVPANIQDELAELKQYRRRYAIERDPEFQKRFNTRLEESNDLVDDALKTIGITEKLRKTIKDMGGISAFVRSDVQIPVRGADGKTNKVDPRQFISLALDTMKASAPDAEAVLRSELAAQRKLEAEREKFVKAESEEAQKYFAALEKSQGQAAGVNAQLEARLDEVIDGFKATVHTSDWMKDLEVPETATAAEQRQIRADNAHRAKLRQFFDAQLGMRVIREAAIRATSQEEIDELANMLIDSARVFHVERDFAKAQKRITELEKELDKVRTAGSRTTTRKSTGREVAATTGEPQEKDFDSPLKYSIAHERWKKSQGAA